MTDNLYVEAKAEVIPDSVTLRLGDYTLETGWSQDDDDHWFRLRCGDREVATGWMRAIPYIDFVEALGGLGPEELMVAALLEAGASGND